MRYRGQTVIPQGTGGQSKRLVLCNNAWEYVQRCYVMYKEGIQKEQSRGVQRCTVPPGSLHLKMREGPTVVPSRLKPRIDLGDTNRSCVPFPVRSPRSLASIVNKRGVVWKGKRGVGRKGGSAAATNSVSLLVWSAWT